MQNAMNIRLVRFVLFIIINPFLHNKLIKIGCYTSILSGVCICNGRDWPIDNWLAD